MSGVVVGIGVDVSHVRGDRLAVHGEGGAVEDVELAALDAWRSTSAMASACPRRNVLVQVGQHDGAGSRVPGPVSVDGLAVHGSLDGRYSLVGGPVDCGRRSDKCWGRRLGGTVVGNVGNTGGLASGGSAHGVGVLADELAAVLDELLRAFLLGGLVIPAAGEGDFHRGSGADGASTQEEGGVAGDNLGIGEGADVADLGLVCGELTVGRSSR